MDGDGWCDLYFCGSDGPNALYRNRGDWQFEDITATAGVGCDGQASTGTALATWTATGTWTCSSTGLAPARACSPTTAAGGGFAERTEEGLGLRSRTGAHSLALADIDGDADLDLYVVNYRPTTFRDEPTSVTGSPPRTTVSNCSPWTGGR